LKEVQNRKLRVFEMNILRRIMGVSRRDRRRNVDVKAELGVDSDVVNKIRHRKLSYFGDVVRMDPSRMPNILLHGQVGGTRPRGRPKTIYIYIGGWTSSGMTVTSSASPCQRQSTWRQRDVCGVGLSIGCWSASTCRLRRSIKSS